MDGVESPRRAVIDALTTPLDTSSRDEAIQRAKPDQRGVSYASRGGEGADPNSIRLVKERYADGQYVVAVNWIDGEGTPKMGVFSFVRRDDGRWQKRGGHHSSGTGTAPTRGRPWVNVGAGGDPFYVGGAVLECEGAALVRLVLNDGVVLEDEPDEAGVVLFPSGRPPHSEWLDGAHCAEIYREGGELIARHPLFGRAELR